MLAPQALPGRYGRVVHAIDHLLQIMACESVLRGGWAVWYHGFLGRITQDVDIVLPADRIEEFLQLAAISGFEVLPRVQGRWPKARHKETDVTVDILPEGARPGTASRAAPTTIPHPTSLGAEGHQLHYIRLPALIELKLAAGRAKDEADVVEILRTSRIRSTSSGSICQQFMRNTFRSSTGWCNGRKNRAMNSRLASIGRSCRLTPRTAASPAPRSARRSRSLSTLPSAPEPRGRFAARNRDRTPGRAASG